MTYYRCVGEVPPTRHTQLRDHDGTLLYEELMGEEGFTSDSSLLYHHKIPSAISDYRDWPLAGSTPDPNSPLMPRRFETHDLFAADSGVDAVTGRRTILGNADVRLGYVAATATSPLYKNALGDECLYAESGSGVVETIFGDLTIGHGDYVVIPRSTIHRIVPHGDEPLRLYAIEATSHIRPPRKFLSDSGQFLEHSPYCERDLRSPTALPRQADEGPTEIHVKHRGTTPGSVAGSIHTIPQHPFDIVGWDGCLYPYVFNIFDYQPITGRVHQPPPVHQVFEGRGFVVCNFVPRKVDYHPDAIPAPYYHANVDSDEVMFYCGGNYEARRGSGIGQGSISLHPAGHVHGPQPGAYEGSIGLETFDELAVMVDTFEPLGLGEAASAVEAPDYPLSWNTQPRAN
ncbi:MAG: homogentisate 1,2-dioxygenase [Acidimicrobiia bacterium]|nr:homogentisate 1,2-dioxygenase [Acidimicrobiia bacterium]